MNVNVVVFLLILTAALAGRASDYTRCSLERQQRLAGSVFGCNVTKIYLFDFSGYFNNADHAVLCNSTVLVTPQG